MRSSNLPLDREHRLSKDDTRLSMGAGAGLPPGYENMPVQLEDSCLSCNGIPSQTVQMFKAACLSYKPSKVAYRYQVFQRNQLMTMRRVLVDKCEEVINKSASWPHG